jgi:hypothetical protein
MALGQGEGRRAKVAAHRSADHPTDTPSDPLQATQGSPMPQWPQSALLPREP